MIDEVIFSVKGGDGGDGLVHFRREKYVPRGGPDGGNGGNGGSVFLVSDPNLTTLRFFSGKDRFTAQKGRHGGKAKKHGEDGEDISLRVPVGTEVYELGSVNGNLLGRKRYAIENSEYIERSARRFVLRQAQDSAWPSDQRKFVHLPPREEEKKIADLDKPDMRVCVARGGRGGRGNWHFKSPTNTTPRTAEPGAPGETRWLRLSLKVLAQVGLVGLPNAGKSTLLSILTAARPSIAPYPFTTVSPNLGVMKSGSASLVVADIPGLIEGASRGKGLGIAFLKHIERCELLVYVLFPEDWVLGLASEERNLGEILWQQREQLRAELAAFSPQLPHLPSIRVLNKIDLLSDEEIKDIRRSFRAKRVAIIPISAATLANISALRRAIVKQYKEAHNT